MDSLTTPSPKQATFLATYRQQVFPFPDSLIYYITKNPSTSKCYEKMYQSCKHFFIKNPILIVQRFYLLIAENNEEIPLFNEKYIDYNKLISKIWITEKFHVNNGTRIKRPCLTSLVPKIYKSDIKELYLGNQYILLDDLKFLAVKCENVKFEGVMNKNGSMVRLEMIIEVLPCLKEFTYCHDKTNTKVFQSTTVPELLKLPHFCNLIYFCLINIPEVFDIDAFYGFIKENKNTKIWLDYNNDISDGFRIRLQKIVNEIVDDENRDFKVPFLQFIGIDQTVNYQLWDLFNKPQ